MKKYLFGILVLGIVLLVGHGGAIADFMEDFSVGNLNSWTIVGDVTIFEQTACLSDSILFESSLEQVISISPGNYLIEFDFKNLLSDEKYTDPNDPDEKSFFDAFFPSLYFSKNGSVVSGIGLFDMDYSGEYYDSGYKYLTGYFSNSVKGVDWNHFQGFFTMTSDFDSVIPYFWLIDANFNKGDDTLSKVYIDNVSINATVPEPSTMLLLGLGIFCLYRYKRKR